MTKVVFYSNPNTLSDHKNFLLLNHASEIRIDAISLVITINIISLLTRPFSAEPKTRIYRKSFDFTSDATHLLKYWEINGDPVVFIGGTPEDTEKTLSVINSKFPKLKCEVHDGYNDVSRQNLLLQLTPETKLVIGMGTPLQEHFAIRIADRNLCSEIYTCGGFISQTAASNGKYYPDLINALHLRWLWRMMYEPHVFKRLVINYPAGLINSIKFYWEFKDKIQ